MNRSKKDFNLKLELFGGLPQFPALTFTTRFIAALNYKIFQPLSWGNFFKKFFLISPVQNQLELYIREKRKSAQFFQGMSMLLSPLKKIIARWILLPVPWKFSVLEL